MRLNCPNETKVEATVETLLALIAIVGVLVYVFNKVAGGGGDRSHQTMDNEIVECASCESRMTLWAFERYDGCPICRSDIFYSTGEYAE